MIRNCKYYETCGNKENCMKCSGYERKPTCDNCKRDNTDYCYICMYGYYGDGTDNKFQRVGGRFLCDCYEPKTKDIKKAIPWERMDEIATQALHGLIEDDYDSAMEYFRDTIELTDEEREYFGIPMETDDEYESDDYDDSAAWEDDSDIGCADCPPDECNGHCMSCSYRPI